MINIPLLSGITNAHQRFSQRIEGILFSFDVDYCGNYSLSPYWSMNIEANGVPVASGLPLNSGAILIDNHNIKSLGRFVFVGDEATIDNLGITNSLVWIPSA